MRHYRKTKIGKMKEVYMGRMQDTVVEAGGCGWKIDWNIAIFMRNDGRSFQDAAYAVLEDQVRRGIIESFKSVFK